jgi:hypothetical protein
MATRLGKELAQTRREKAEQTLLAMKEFKQYLEGMEKDLGRMSRKFSNREVAQGVGLVATGIHEALNYLAIVKKAIEKTERAVARRTSGVDGATLSWSP